MNMDTEKILLEEIVIVKASLDNDYTSLDQYGRFDGFDVSNKLVVQIDLEQKHIFHQLSIGVRPQVAGKLAAHVQFDITIELYYRVENLEELAVVNADGAIELDRLLSTTLAGISYSTVRGIVYSRTLGTLMHGCLLPIIKPDQLFS
jgi:hypothetical protein